MMNEPGWVLETATEGRSPSAYGYAGGNPISNSDPDGLDVVNNSLSQKIAVKVEGAKEPGEEPPDVYVVRANGVVEKIDVTENGQVVTLEPGDRFISPQDGIALPETNPGEVFKNPNGIDLIVNEDNSIDVLGGLVDKLKQAAGGGWKDESWQKNLNSKKDYGWDPLFQASRSDPKNQK